MNVTVKKITDKALLDRASSFTVNREVHPDLRRMYLSEHSPARTQMFWVEMTDISTSTSVHFVRHKVGVEHFVKSNREDRGEHTPGSSKTYGGFTAEFFREFFEYREGKLYWKKKFGRCAKVHAGSPAGGFATRDRCAMIGVGGKRLYASVVIFMMFHGYRPPVVDHADRNRQNDKVENLRAATHGLNRANSCRQTGESGYRGVRKDRHRFVARVHVDHEEVIVGRFDTAQKAALAYDEAALKYFGDFATLNFPDSETPKTRHTPTDHAMLLNAQALINMARKRLCRKAHGLTRDVMKLIRVGVAEVDPDLGACLIPECEYRGGVCHEFTPCGKLSRSRNPWLGPCILPPPA